MKLLKAIESNSFNGKAIKNNFGMENTFILNF